MINVPCYNCQDRFVMETDNGFVTCHSSCEAYKNYKVEVEKQKQEKQKMVVQDYVDKVRGARYANKRRYRNEEV